MKSKKLNHREKQRLARRISGLQTGHFESPQWEARAKAIQKKVKKKGGE